MENIVVFFDPSEITEESFRFHWAQLGITKMPVFEEYRFYGIISNNPIELIRFSNALLSIIAPKIIKLSEFKTLKTLKDVQHTICKCD